MFHLLTKEVVLELLCYNYNNLRECNKWKKNVHEQILLEKYNKGFPEVSLGNSPLLTHPHRQSERLFRKFVLHKKCFEACVWNSWKHV